MSHDSGELEERRDLVRKWIHEACLGRVQATDGEIGQKISLFGTIKQLLRRRDEA
jgi:hypothetical protein